MKSIEILFWCCISCIRLSNHSILLSKVKTKQKLGILRRKKRMNEWRNERKSAVSYLSQMEVFDTSQTRPTQTHPIQTDTCGHTFQSRMNGWSATATPLSFTCKAVKYLGLRRCVFWFNSEITSRQRRSTTSTYSSFTVLLPWWNKGSKSLRNLNAHTHSHAQITLAIDLTHPESVRLNSHA